LASERPTDKILSAVFIEPIRQLRNGVIHCSEDVQNKTKNTSALLNIMLFSSTLRYIVSMTRKVWHGFLYFMWARGEKNIK